MDPANEFALYATLHSNAIGFLYELCAKQKVEAPKITCLASARGEYVLRMTAFSLQHTGIGARKNEAKTIAACKILIQLGHLQAPTSVGALDQRNQPPSNAEIGPPPTQPSLKDILECLPEENVDAIGKTVAPPTLSSLAVPAFNPDNPLLSVNWILRNADQTLAHVQYVQLTPKNGGKELWQVVCTAGEYSVSASAQSKRKALVTAGESMYNFLLSNIKVQDLLRKFEQSMIKTAPVKKARATPPNWGVFRHRLFLPGQVMQNLMQHNGWEDEVAAPSGEVLAPPERKLQYLASQMGFACRIITWPQGQHFFRSKKRKLQQEQDITEAKGVLLSLFITFSTNRQALSFHGHGASMELAKSSAAEGALRYFRVMARGANDAPEKMLHAPASSIET